MTTNGSKLPNLHGVIISVLEIAVKQNYEIMPFFSKLQLRLKFAIFPLAPESAYDDEGQKVGTCRSSALSYVRRRKKMLSQDLFI